VTSCCGNPFQPPFFSPFLFFLSFLQSDGWLSCRNFPLLFFFKKWRGLAELRRQTFLIYLFLRRGLAELRKKTSFFRRNPGALTDNDVASVTN
jgi:hypothetical protein